MRKKIKIVQFFYPFRLTSTVFYVIIYYIYKFFGTEAQNYGRGNFLPDL